MTNWDEWRDAWTSATHLYAHLANGGTPQSVFTPLRLNPGETAFCDLTVMYSRFYGKDVSYQQYSGLFFGSPLFVAAGLAANVVGNNVVRNRAEAKAAPQWREQCVARTIVTDRRTMCFAGQQWLAFDHEAVVEFTADLRRGVCFLNFGSAEPLCLAGFSTPWLSVLLCYFLYGTTGVAQMPYLRPLASGPV